MCETNVTAYMNVKDEPIFIYGQLDLAHPVYSAEQAMIRSTSLIGPAWSL